MCWRAGFLPSFDINFTSSHVLYIPHARFTIHLPTSLSLIEVQQQCHGVSATPGTPNAIGLVEN